MTASGAASTSDSGGAAGRDGSAAGSAAGASGGAPAGASGGAPAKRSAKAPAKASRKAPAKASTEAAAKAEAKGASKAPPKAAAKGASKEPAKAPAKEPAKAPAKSSAKPPVKAARGESRTALVRRARRINRELAEVYPYAHPELDFEDSFQLLVATVLSAQTTDLRVNQTTPALFAAYPAPEDLAAADPARVEELIRPTGFFRAKTRSIIGLSTALRDDFGGEVPGELKDLVKLPGVGRKTAFVVLGNAFGFAT